ncbi:hypothetical protein PJP07_30060, partial [Mycobacterium kansasii]
RSLDHDVWDIVENGYVPLTNQVVLDSGTTITKPKSKEMWMVFDKDKQTSEAKAMNAIYCVVSQDIFNQISMCGTSKEAWDLLETTHEGTTTVKRSKLQLLTS